MRKVIHFFTLGVALVAMLALGNVSRASNEAVWPPLKVDLSIQQDGNTFTAVVWVKNEGDFNTDNLNVRGQVPKGTKYVDSWAGSGRGFNAGVFDGNDVGWVNTSGVKAGGRQGPFVYIFDASALSPTSKPSVSAWVSWAGKAPGNAVSRPVSIQIPTPALDVAVGTPPAGAAPVPSAAASTEEGKTLFSNKGCAACHGANAEGGIARALGGRKGPEITTAVRNGRGIMPAFTPAQLSDGELQSIVTFIEGLPSAGGWVWAVAEITAGANEVAEGTTSHGFFWIFDTIQGSHEVSTAEGTKVFSSGEAVFVPARQEHTHRYSPQSRTLAFGLHPADNPPSAFHRGRQLLATDVLTGARAGLNYRLQVREFNLAPGEGTPERVSAESSFVYVVEGTLTSRVGGAVTSTEEGKASAVPPNVRQIMGNEGSTPLRFILVDLHP